MEIEPTDRTTRVDIATRYLGAQMGTAYVDSDRAVATTSSSEPRALGPE